MASYSTEQRVTIVEKFFQSGSSTRATYRALRDTFGQFNRPTEQTIRNIVNKFKTTGSVLDQRSPVRARFGRSAENIAAVSRSVAEDPTLSVPRRSQQLGLSQMTTWRILTKDLSLHAYKIQLTQELKPRDHGQRRAFAEWVLAQVRTDPDFHQKIMLSDEAHFDLRGYVNKQNCRIWGLENPREMVERPMHPNVILFGVHFRSQASLVHSFSRTTKEE